VKEMETKALSFLASVILPDESEFRRLAAAYDKAREELRDFMLGAGMDLELRMKEETASCN
jgi:hypothetical protein